MLMCHHEVPKVTEDEEPPTEQDKRKKMVSYKPNYSFLVCPSPVDLSSHSSLAGESKLSKLCPSDRVDACLRRAEVLLIKKK